MNVIEGSVVILVIFAVVAIVVTLRNSGGTKLKLTAGGTALDVDKHDSPPGALIDGATAQEGNVVAEDETGTGAHVLNTTAKVDITAINRNPNKPDPKA